MGSQAEQMRGLARSAIAAFNGSGPDRTYALFDQMVDVYVAPMSGESNPKLPGKDLYNQLKPVIDKCLIYIPTWNVGIHSSGSIKVVNRAGLSS